MHKKLWSSFSSPGYAVKCLNGYFIITCFHFFRKWSGFRPGNSCTNQLISTAHKILSAFDDNHEVSGVFLDISKAFDRVWHEGWLFKLQQNEISGELITLIKNFMSCRTQSVVLNDQHSSWAYMSKRASKRAYLKGQFVVLYYF